MSPAAKEDLAHTPAERAAAAAASAAKKLSLDEELQRFAGAEEIIIGKEPGHMVVLGAGLVGALCASILCRKGFKVDVFERYEDIRSIPSVGRSINLSVTSRGMRAVKALGGTFYDDMMKLATRIRGRIIHMANGKTVFQRYGKDDTECNYSVSRIDLNKFLIDKAAAEGATFHFNHNLSETSDFGGSELTGCTLHFTKGGPKENTPVRMKVCCPVIACDGGGSRVRYALRRSGLTEFSEDVLTKGYKEVLFPKPEGESHFGATGEDGSEACHGAYGLHIWPRGDHMLMALSNVDGSFTGTFYMENKGSDETFDAFGDTDEGRSNCKGFCEKHYNDAAPWVGGMDPLVRQITSNPNGILGTVKTTKWAIQGKVVLIGDSSHAMVPFFGQGCNCGFEDTLWLSKLLDQHCGGDDGRHNLDKCTGENFARVFDELEKERKPNADAISEMALENFIEMRDKTGDVKFQAMKKVENKLENTFPGKFRSRYAMVCYGGEGNISYANAKELGVVQWPILERLCDGLDAASTEEEVAAKLAKVDLVLAEQLIDEILMPEQKRRKMDLSTVKH
jgi:kynurenine 3-monooxygenase